LPAPAAVRGQARCQEPRPAAILDCIIVLASRIMNAIRRTTVAAPDETLRTLEAEAARLGVPLTRVLRDAVEEKATAIRKARRPHVAVGRSTDGRTAAEVTAEPIAEPPR
jgi:hypothetical protein